MPFKSLFKDKYAGSSPENASVVRTLFDLFRLHLASFSSFVKCQFFSPLRHQAHLLWTDPALYSQDNISAAFVAAASGAHAAAAASLGDPPPSSPLNDEPLPVFQV